MVDRHEHTHSVVAAQLVELPSIENSLLAYRWPVMSMPLTESLDIVVGVDYVGILQVTPGDNN